MIKNLISSLLTALRYNGALLSKWELFSCLFQLSNLRSREKSRDREVKFKLFGSYFSAYSYHTLNYLIREIFVNDEYRFSCNNANPLIIDCGANIGMSILYFKKNYPTATVIAFEPNPTTYELLQKNRSSYHLSNVSIHNLALSNVAGNIPFHFNDDKGTLTGSIQANRGGSKVINVPCELLSMHLRNFEVVDLIKMDVEGAEHQIVDDLMSSGAIHKVKELIVEYHHNIPGEKNSFPDFLKRFEDVGFDYSIRTNFSDLGVMQDVLLHFYKK